MSAPEVAVVSCTSCFPVRAAGAKPPTSQPPQPPPQQRSAGVRLLSPPQPAPNRTGTAARKSVAPRFGRRFTVDYTSNVDPKDAAEWQLSFDKLMASPVGRRVFGEFLKLEHSYCNLEFWSCCERLSATSDKAEYARQARAMYDKFISPNSSQEVNLDGRVRQYVQRACSADPETANFDEAARQVYTLMSLDSYHRFIRSAPLLELLAGPGGQPTQPRASSTLPDSPEADD